MNNYYLYDISHPNKHGVPLQSLDEDPEVLSIDGSVVEHLTFNQLAVEVHVCSICKKPGHNARTCPQREEIQCIK